MAYNYTSIGMVPGGSFYRKGHNLVWRCVSVNYAKNFVIGEYEAQTFTVPFSEVEVVSDGYKQFVMTEDEFLDDFLKKIKEPAVSSSEGWDLGEESAILEEWQKPKPLPVKVPAIAAYDASKYYPPVTPPKASELTPSDSWEGAEVEESGIMPDVKSPWSPKKKPTDEAWMDEFTGGGESIHGDGSRWDEI